MNTWVIISLVGWVVCGVLAYGMANAHFSRAYPLRYKGNHYFISMFVAIAGPIGLVTTMISGGAKYGFLYKELTEKECYELLAKKEGEDFADFCRKQPSWYWN